jgi:hypothetical protein
MNERAQNVNAREDNQATVQLTQDKHQRVK